MLMEVHRHASSIRLLRAQRLEQNQTIKRIVICFSINVIEFSIYTLRKRFLAIKLASAESA